MYPYLNTAVAHILVAERLHDAEQRRLVAATREPHLWRHRVGAGLIALGRTLADEPANQPRPRARMT
jgi:hypothetical protein